MKTTKLQNHKSSQCHIEITETDHKTLINFYSYSTLVISAEYANGLKEWEVECTGTYSNTTRRQISWFLNEYFDSISYYDIKKIAGTKFHMFLNNNKQIIDIR